MTRWVPCDGPAGSGDRYASDGEPVVAPLPDVARHVVQPVAVGGEGVRGRGAEVAVVERVAGRELALPHVHPVLAARLPLVAPRIVRTDDSPARRAFPLGLGRQPQARPRGERGRVGPAHVHHRVVGAVDARPTADPRGVASPRPRRGATTAWPRRPGSAGSRRAGARRTRRTTRRPRPRCGSPSRRRTPRTARSSPSSASSGTAAGAPRAPAPHRPTRSRPARRDPSRTRRRGSRPGPRRSLRAAPPRRPARAWGHPGRWWTDRGRARLRARSTRGRWSRHHPPRSHRANRWRVRRCGVSMGRMSAPAAADH